MMLDWMVYCIYRYFTQTVVLFYYRPNSIYFLAGQGTRQ
jgi:hypothetical protein